jgi:hypothetical protein
MPHRDHGVWANSHSVTRPAARLAPATRELLAEPETHMHAVADEFDRSR